uniref:Uncharacterized protein n=1 Tax=viral metagenome TaxID=1070528 RepID=A0A6C0ITM8_9ZZZZ
MNNVKKIHDKNFKNRIILYFNKLRFKYQPPGVLRSFNYEKTNDYYLYSSVIIQKKKTLMIQPIKRVADNNSSNPFTLNKFSMISVRKNNKNMDSTINLIIPFLKNFCKIDISKIGCVSLSSNNTYGFEGIENYIPLLKSWGINENNILIRNADEAVREASGDGYWKDPDPNFSNYQGWTISLHYQRENNANIENYTDYNSWIEIGELAEEGGVMGYERIKYAIQNENTKQILNSNKYTLNNNINPFKKQNWKMVWH